MKQFQIFYCAGPQNLELCLNTLIERQAENQIDLDLEVYPHAGRDPRYTVVARWLPKKEGGDS